MSNIESARRGQAAGLAAQQAQQNQAAYQSGMQRYQMNPETQSGGLLGGFAEKLLPGIGGQIYSGMRFG
jgi:hypothetical protein